MGMLMLNQGQGGGGAEAREIVKLAAPVGVAPVSRPGAAQWNEIWEENKNRKTKRIFGDVFRDRCGF